MLITNKKEKWVKKQQKKKQETKLNLIQNIHNQVQALYMVSCFAMVFPIFLVITEGFYYFETSASNGYLSLSVYLKISIFLFLIQTIFMFLFNREKTRLKYKDLYIVFAILNSAKTSVVAYSLLYLFMYSEGYHTGWYYTALGIELIGFLFMLRLLFGSTYGFNKEVDDNDLLKSPNIVYGLNVISLVLGVVASIVGFVGYYLGIFISDDFSSGGVVVGVIGLAMILQFALNFIPSQLYVHKISNIWEDDFQEETEKDEL